MQESDRREIALSGVETALLSKTLEHHEPKTSDVDTETIDELESRFETDFEETADGRFGLTRAAAPIVVSLIEEYEPLVDEQTEARLEELREQFVDVFELEEQPSTKIGPVEEEEYCGSTEQRIPRHQTVPVGRNPFAPVVLYAIRLYATEDVSVAPLAQQTGLVMDPQ